MAMILPPAPWRDRDGLDALADALGSRSGNARFVGGAVRDTLLGRDVDDIDVATPLHPDEVVDRIRAAGFKPVPTGLAHGTITAVLPSGPVEVTTLRRDVATDGRHAVVAFSGDWQEDASRRDFTMNALYADPHSGEIFDYFGGLQDLAVGRVRFIGDPRARIAEDHLRILRFFRFHARFGDLIDEAGLDACVERANDLMALSRERISAELLKLLVAREAVSVASLMVAHGILSPVLPEIGPDGSTRLAHLAARERAASVAPDAIRRLAALLPPDVRVADDVAARLRLSKAQRKRLTGALAANAEDSPEALAYRNGIETAVDRLLLSDQPVDVIRAIAAWHPPTLPLTGGALVARGLAKGPDVARTLREVEDRWIAEGFPDAGRVSDLADAVVAQLLRTTISS